MAESSRDQKGQVSQSVDVIRFSCDVSTFVDFDCKLMQPEDGTDGCDAEEVKVTWGLMRAEIEDSE